MSPADLIMFAAFLLVLLLGAGALWWQQRWTARPTARIRQRLESVKREQAGLHHDVLEQLERARLLAQRRRRRARLGPVLGGWLTRISTIGGRRVWLQLLLSGAIGLLLAAAIVLYFDWQQWLEIKTLVLGPLLLMLWTLGNAIRSFRKRFLAQLPEAVDMIRRASRAGVPPIQALRAVGDDIPSPLGPEFRAIGDSLFLGDDMDEVLDEASQRIRIPEFSFFTVFLKTQRATGGPMNETLENLAEILRERATLDLKVRAMTAEGRAMSFVMAALPFGVFALMFVVNRDYIMMLVTTEAGHRMLIIAAVMMVIGLLMIRRLSRLED